MDLAQIGGRDALCFREYRRKVIISRQIPVKMGNFIVRLIRWGLCHAPQSPAWAGLDFPDKIRTWRTARSCAISGYARRDLRRGRRSGVPTMSLRSPHARAILAAIHLEQAIVHHRHAQGMAMPAAHQSGAGAQVSRPAPDAAGYAGPCGYGRLILFPTPQLVWWI